jgi:hypothetical protein
MKHFFPALWAFLSLLSLSTGAPTPSQASSDTAIDFNTLLDGSLGYMPALLLVSQGTLAELTADDSTESSQSQGLEVRSPSCSDGCNTTTPYVDPASSSPSDRTGKEDGAVAGALISNLLVPAVTNIIDDGLAVGLCKSLVNSATGVAGTVVGQEATKAMYPANDTSASDFKQGLIPGTFVGSIVTNGAGTALSKALCKGLVPSLEKLWSGTAVANALVSNALNCGLKEVLTARLQDIGVDAARAVQFTSQMQDAF